MSRIELNHWYIKDNELSISLMKFYTKIKILKNDQTFTINCMSKEMKIKN